LSDLCNITLTTKRSQYFLRKLVNSGGMADVYLAWDQARSTKMAIKILRDASLSRIFTREFELNLERLDHPSIVRFFEFGENQGIVFIVMEWVDGADLQEVINNRAEPFPLEEVSIILQPVCSALNFAHNNNVFHCDIKPANILLHKDGRILLTDFGIARFAAEKGIGGTPLYMAPEQFAKRAVDARTDIYSLGVTMYEMLSGGLLPFRGESPSSRGSTPGERIGWEHCYLPLPPLRDYTHNVPDSVIAVIETALRKKPDQRYSTTLELKDAFEQSRLQVAPIASTKEKSRFGELTVVFENLTQDFPQKLPQNPRAPKPQTPQDPHPVNTHPASVKKSAIKPREIHLAGISGDLAGQFIPITAKELSIGRSSSNQLHLSEQSVSRRHATILRTRRGVYIRDDGSTLGTFVNRQSISGYGPVRLKHGDVIQIGYYQVFEFHER